MFASSSNEHYGIFRLVQGDVNVLSHQNPKFKKKAKIGMKVYPGDSIFSLKNSKAQILMIDKNLILLPPQSKIKIQEKNKKKSSNQKKDSQFTPYLVRLFFGKIRSQVYKKQKDEVQKNSLQSIKNKKSKEINEESSRRKGLKKSNLLKMNTYQIWTKAAVIGVRGTDFSVFFEPKKNSATAFSIQGEITFYPFKEDGSLFPPIPLTPGQIMTQKLYSRPQEPTLLKKRTQEELMKELQIPNPTQKDSSIEVDKVPVEKSSQNKEKDNLKAPISLVLPEDFMPQEKYFNKEHYSSILQSTLMEKNTPHLKQVSPCKAPCIQRPKKEKDLRKNFQNRIELQRKKNNTSFLTLEIHHEN